MTDFDLEYARVLDAIRQHGYRKGNRTGIDTISLPGQTMRVSLANGELPLLTTKRVAVKTALGELMWMVKGHGTLDYLHANNVKIWDDWRQPYTHRREAATVIRRQGSPNSEYIGDFAIPEADPGSTRGRLLDTWQSMMRRCYDPTHRKYPSFGDAGVTVHPAWHDPETFLSDTEKLPHWVYKKDDWDSFILDKDYFGASQYGPGTSVWLSRAESDSYLSHPTDDAFLRRFALIEDGDLGRVYGVQWRHWRQPGGGEVDQLAEVIRQLRETPDSRRIIISAWNPGEIDQMALPPCPTMIQFVVNPDENGDLNQIDAILTQRSADMFLGVPFDIFSYGVLTHLLARETGLNARSLTWTGGDCHIYENHLDQVDLQLSREPIDGVRPTIEVRATAGELDVLEPSDIGVVGYESHGTIKGTIAV